MEMIESFMNNHKRETSNVKYLIVIRIYIDVYFTRNPLSMDVSLIKGKPLFSSLDFRFLQLSPIFSKFLHDESRVKTVVDGHPSAFFIGTNR